MLKGISPLIHPELLSIIYRMGHGDEILLANAHFPAETNNSQVLRVDGIGIERLLAAIMPLFELDAYVDSPIKMMSPIGDDVLNPNVEKGYLDIIKKHHPQKLTIEKLDRFAFYDLAQKAFAIITTSETEKFSHLFLKKGITPLD